jgi:hypothetical protein
MLQRKHRATPWGTAEPSAWRKSLAGVLDGPATPIVWNIDKSE